MVRAVDNDQAGLVCSAGNLICIQDNFNLGVVDHTDFYRNPQFLMGSQHMLSKFYLPDLRYGVETNCDCVSKDNLHDKAAAYEVTADSKIEDNMVGHPSISVKVKEYGCFHPFEPDRSYNKNHNYTFVGAIARQQPLSQMV